MTMDGLMVFAVLVLVAAALSGAWLPRWWLALTLAGTAALLGASFWILGGGAEWDWRSGFALGGERLHLRLDAISAWFLALWRWWAVPGRSMHASIGRIASGRNRPGAGGVGGVR